VAGGFIGYAVGKKKQTGTEAEASSSEWLGAGLGAILGGGAGYGIGALFSRDKVYTFRGETPAKVAAAIAALQRKARVPDFR
jgi:membrane protein DedA with SNARE-associated domain